MLTGLAAVHPLLARWNKSAETRLESSKPFCAMPPRIDELAAILESDPFTPGVPSDGYAVHAWNALDRRDEVWLRHTEDGGGPGRIRTCDYTVMSGAF